MYAAESDTVDELVNMIHSEELCADMFKEIMKFTACHNGGFNLEQLEWLIKVQLEIRYTSKMHV